MSVKELTELLVNNGTAIAIIIYFMYRDFKFMQTLQGTLDTLVNTVNTLKELITNRSVTVQADLVN